MADPPLLGGKSRSKYQTDKPGSAYITLHQFYRMPGGIAKRNDVFTAILGHIEQSKKNPCTYVNFVCKPVKPSLLLIAARESIVGINANKLK